MSGLRVPVVLALAASLALGASNLVQAQEVDVTGTWSLTMVSGDPDERTRGTLRLEQEGEALSGTWSREDQVEADMDVSGAVDGTTVRFSWGAGGMTVSFVGEVREDDGDVMAGTFEIGDQVSGEWTARKAGPRAR